MKKITYIYFISFLSAVALPAFAAVTDFKSLIDVVFINGIIRPIVPLLIGLGVVLFIYGVLKTMISEGGEGKEEGKQFMIWGIVGIFVMVSVWGLVSILQTTFQLPTKTPSILIR